MNLPPKPAGKGCGERWCPENALLALLCLTMPMYLQKGSIECLKLNRQNYYVSHSLPHNIYRINCSSLFHCFHPLYTTFFTMDVQKQPRGCHCFGMRSRSRYISQFPSGEGLEISVFSSLQGGDSKKHVSWNPLRKLGIPNPPEIHGYIFF